MGGAQGRHGRRADGDTGLFGPWATGWHGAAGDGTLTSPLPSVSRPPFEPVVPPQTTMTSQRFTPALRQTTILPIFPPSASTDTSPAGERALNFTYVPSNGFAAGKTPEVWSNLPLATSTGAGEQPDQPQWHAVPFSPSPEAKGVFVARLPLAPDTEGSFEYTFRLRSTDSPDHVEWLGSEGSNGLVVIVRLDDAALSAAQEGLKTADGQGWRDLGEGLKVWKGAIPVDDGQKASLNWSAFVRGERWCDADAVVWEQTPCVRPSRPWRECCSLIT